MVDRNLIERIRNCDPQRGIRLTPEEAQQVAQALDRPEPPATEDRALKAPARKRG